jgi:DNA uptake protein ComE-like DNA-binding protein
MKKIFTSFLRSWFGHTRRERRASFTILIVIILVALSRYAVPSADNLIEIIPLGLTAEQIPDSGKPVEESTFVRQTASRFKGPEREPFDLNSCDSAMLESLPGIGPVLSARIIKYRNLLGGFAKVDQLREVYGLPEETFGLIRNMVYADTLRLRKIRINEADFATLIRMPYLERHEVTAILSYRQTEGRIEGQATIIANKLIDTASLSRLRPYIEY